MLAQMQSKILEKQIPYLGSELRPHWVLENTGIYGPCIVAFVGECNVATGELVDWEDRLAEDRIYAREMLHFLGEFYGISLETGVHCQRLFMVWAERLLRERGLDVARKGDDLYVGGRKLSVSIATASAVSVLIHWGMNIDPHGAPPSVKACGFQEFGWSKAEVFAFAKELLAQYIGELEEIRIAQCKVRPVT